MSHRRNGLSITHDLGAGQQLFLPNAVPWTFNLHSKPTAYGISTGTIFVQPRAGSLHFQTEALKRMPDVRDAVSSQAATEYRLITAPFFYYGGTLAHLLGEIPGAQFFIAPGANRLRAIE